MKQTKLHMIGDAHIDPVWLWPWQEGFHEVKATFRSALDRMKEYDDFIFVASSAAFYAWVETSDPAMFAEIQQRVSEGRWQVVGGWWIEPDCNIPGGEAFVRQGLYGQRYFKSKFGVLARVGFNVDSFGHAATLPQILSKSGIPYYTFLRPMPHEKHLPERLFWWEADDGSRVLTFRIPFEYLSWGNEVDAHVARCAAEIRAPFDEGMCFYGVGNHGGGPTKQNIESIHRLNGDPNLPEIVMSSPEAFFDSMAHKNLPIPIVHDELQRHAPGCYAAHSGIKQWNRRAEHHLVTAEKWSLLANWVNQQPYPDDFDRAWKSLLFNQFHDILAGTSLEIAYDDARNSIGEALAIADRALNYAVQSFAWNVHIEPEDDMRPIIVFNPHTWSVRANVELESNRWKPEAVFVDDQDQPVPFQQVQSTTVTGRVRLSFAADLPALGYRVYRLRPSGSRGSFPSVAASDTVLENARFRLEIDPETGCAARLFDKRAQVEVFSKAAAVPLVMEDTSDTWGHDTFRYDKVIGTFRATRVQLAEHGAAKSVIRVMSAYGQSTLIQDFTMYPDRDQIDVHVVVDWHEQFKLLKLSFPVNVYFMRISNEIAYGHIQQAAVGDEAPCQSWIDLSGTARGGQAYGFSLLNDAKYSFDVNVNTLNLTLLRSPAYAHHIPATVDTSKLHAFIDQGIQRFSYSMLPHSGGWETAGTVKRAAELNQRPTALFAAFHADGKLPQSDSFIDVQPDNVVVTVLKQAEDGGDLIIRAYESTKTATSAATIRLPKWNRVIEAGFAPGEIKTFRVPRDSAQPVIETNLLEWER
ncbi:MAG: alpha-mannosidase [Chloroflexi bacterium]|nr:alpha-mannosidase [Chloroflexota bacterium]